MDEYNIGTDIDRHWFLTGEGDLATVSYGDNLAQAIYNRLTCPYGELKWCYEDYGSYVEERLGTHNTQNNRQLLQDEIQRRLREDPRLSNVTVNILKYDAFMVGFRVKATVTDTHEDLEEYFLFGADKSMISSDARIGNSDWRDTYIISRSKGYFGVAGQRVTIHAHVLCKDDNSPVPIGNVSVRLGGRVLASVEVQQSGDYEPATMTLTFTVPAYLSIGDHDLTLYYGGIRGYNSSILETTFEVVEKLPTTTKILESMSTTQDYTYYNYSTGTYETLPAHKGDNVMVDVYDRTTTAHALVDDGNGLPVTEGEIVFKLEAQSHHKMPTKIYFGENPVIMGQEYLKVTNARIIDQYGRPVVKGELSILSKEKKAIQMIVSDFANIQFISGTHLVDGRVYRLVDSEGNLVDNLVYNESEGTLNTTTEEGTYEIIVKESDN